MQSKLKNLKTANSFLGQSLGQPLDKMDPWFISGTIHALLGACALVLVYGSFRSADKSVDIEIIDAPRISAQAVPLTEPKASPQKPRGHEVYGLSRKTLTTTASESEEVKAGNTTAKTPDQETLKPADADSLPIPSADYLVTQMPRLKVEVRVPYPEGPKKKGIQGAVVMDLLIDSTGKVREVQPIDAPDPELNVAALAAAKSFEFTPALIQEKPVAVRIRYSYRFVLEH